MVKLSLQGAVRLTPAPVSKVALSGVEIAQLTATLRPTVADELCMLTAVVTAFTSSTWCRRPRRHGGRAWWHGGSDVGRPQPAVG